MRPYGMRREIILAAGRQNHQRRFQQACRRYPMVLRSAARGMGVERGTAYLRGKTGETEDAWLCIPSERLRAKYERLVADEESTQSDYDKLYEELSAYSDTLTTEQLMDWFIDLNDPETISGWTERIEAHNAYIDVMEPNNAVLRNPLDVDSTFHIRIYDYFIDFHEDREIVDDLEFTPSDVDADDWTEDIKRCLEENGWRLDSKIGTDSDDSDLLVFDCVKA